MPLALIPMLLLIVPILEISVFILVGNMIGLMPTLGLVVGSAIIGALLLRRQGLSTLLRIRQEMAAGRVPGRELVHGMMIVVAGVLLLTPGLVTDAVGYLLFIPKIRELGWRFLRGRVGVVAMGAPPGAWRAGVDPRGPSRRRTGPDIIDLTPDSVDRRPDPNSPWTNGRDGTLH